MGCIDRWVGEFGLVKVETAGSVSFVAVVRVE